METQKLYYADCHLRRFSAIVTGCRPAGTQWAVTLDATAFYPEGGGQACDTGVLGGVQVLDVQETAEGILHFCGGPLVPGARVEGEINYARRFELMQQHTGEHIVSGIIHRRFGWHNVGFHMGADVVTIDFDGPISPSALPEIEAEANRAVWENLPLRCWYPAPEELAVLSYRTKRALPWPVRIVEVPGIDRCACCGVHTAATGEVGLVKLFSCVKFHEGVRMEMACGGRALALLSAVYEQNRLVSQAFSAKPLETGEAAQRMNQLLSQEKFRAVGLEKRVLDAIAYNYVNRGDVLHFEPGLSAAALRELTDRIRSRCGGVAAVFSGSDGSGYSFCIMGPGDLRPLGRAMTQALNGRGGGRSDSQQGTVHAAEADIRNFFSGLKP